MTASGEALDAEQSVARHDVSVRVPAWFSSDGFTMTSAQLADAPYVFHGFIPELEAFFHHSPEELEISVDGGPWQRTGGPRRELPDIEGDPRASWTPNLTPEELAALPVEGTDVDPAEIPYGVSLPDVIASQGPWRSWLEAAVHAGYVPHQEGIELAQQAQFLFIRVRVQEYIDRGVLGEALGWLQFYNPYRALAAQLLAEADALEAWAGRLAGDGDGDGDGDEAVAVPQGPQGPQSVVLHSQGGTSETTLGREDEGSAHVIPRHDPGDATVPRRVRGLVVANAECEGSQEDALAQWAGHVEDLVDDPSFWAFVRPGGEWWDWTHMSERQAHMGKAIEYLELEHRDGVPLHPQHAARLQRMIDGEHIPCPDMCDESMHIPVDDRDRGIQEDGTR